MDTQAMTYRDRAAIEAYARAKAIGGLAYDAWLAAVRAYGQDDPASRLRINEIIPA